MLVRTASRVGSRTAHHLTMVTFNLISHNIIHFMQRLVVSRLVCLAIQQLEFPRLWTAWPLHTERVLRPTVPKAEVSNCCQAGIP